MGVAYSSDGFTFRKPILNVTQFRNSTRNNLVSGLGEMELEGNSVWIDEHAPPDERYKNIAKSLSRKFLVAPEGSGLVLSVSSDGVRWRTKAIWSVTATCIATNHGIMACCSAALQAIETDS